MKQVAPAKIQKHQACPAVNVYVDFPNVAADPFGGKDGEVFVQTICGALQVRSSKCFTSYDAKTKVATLQFHYAGSKWAEKAVARIEAMQRVFSGCKIRDLELVAKPEGESHDAA